MSLRIQIILLKMNLEIVSRHILMIEKGVSLVKGLLIGGSMKKSRFYEVLGHVVPGVIVFVFISCFVFMSAMLMICGAACLVSFIQWSPEFILAVTGRDCVLVILVCSLIVGFGCTLYALFSSN